MFLEPLLILAGDISSEMKIFLLIGGHDGHKEWNDVCVYESENILECQVNVVAPHWVLVAGIKTIVACSSSNVSHYCFHLIDFSSVVEGQERHLAVFESSSGLLSSKGWEIKVFISKLSLGVLEQHPDLKAVSVGSEIS